MYTYEVHLSFHGPFGDHTLEEAATCAGKSRRNFVFSTSARELLLREATVHVEGRKRARHFVGGHTYLQ